MADIHSHPLPVKTELKMPIFKKQNRGRFHSTQTAIVFIIIIAVLIAITFVTVNIGKVALDKTYSGNATDSAALSAASAMAYAFNYVANVNAGNDNNTFKKNWDKFKTAYTNLFNNAKNNLYANYTKYSTKAKGHWCCIGNDVAVNASNDAKTAANWAQKYAKQMNELIKQAWPESKSSLNQSGNEIGAIPNAAQQFENSYLKVRETVHDDQDGQNDIYHDALYLGYMYNFNNSGISHRLGKIDQKMYSAFLQSITPETITNGEPETFTWVDGAGRVHTVTAIVIIDPVHTYELQTTKGKRPDIKSKLLQAKELATQAENTASQASDKYASAAQCPDMPVLECFSCCPGINSYGTDLMNDADTLMQQANNLAEEVRASLNADDTFTSTQKTDTHENEIIKHIKDIKHNRQVESYNFQFHMGGPVKGMRGDIDISTIYPPVVSDSTASFAGNGNIENGQASHDASLVAAN